MSVDQSTKIDCSDNDYGEEQLRGNRWRLHEFAGDSQINCEQMNNIALCISQPRQSELAQLHAFDRVVFRFVQNQVRA